MCALLCVLQSNDWVRVRIQQMEPDLMEVGSNLEEAKQLRREHDDLLYKLGVSQLTHDVIASRYRAASLRDSLQYQTQGVHTCSY